MINRDEWGVSWTTLLPPRVIAPNAVDTDLAYGNALLGCRVPYADRVALRARQPAKPAHQLAASTTTPRCSSSSNGDGGCGAADGPRRFRRSGQPGLRTELQCAGRVRAGVAGDCRAFGRVLHIEQHFRVARHRRGCDRSAEAIELARAENNKGVGNESYDFYLLLKSERMAGWPLPANLREKVMVRLTKRETRLVIRLIGS